MIMYLYILCNTPPIQAFLAASAFVVEEILFFLQSDFFCWFGQPKRIVWQKSLFLFPQIILLWRRRLLLNSPSFSTFGRLQKFSIFCTMYNCHARWSLINNKRLMFIYTAIWMLNTAQYLFQLLKVQENGVLFLQIGTLLVFKGHKCHRDTSRSKTTIEFHKLELQWNWLMPKIETDQKWRSWDF